MSLNAANAQDVDTDAGKTLYLDVCAKCHGPTGKGLASFPKVAGQDADYISSRLEQYRAKEKVGPNSPLMIPNAVNLSDEDIANLSAHIAEDLQ
ncbi:MAG: c-type cytochrome [Hyphomicrobiales bacterium]|nr:c-type cytochrome [Hyphomicrobiales bacterium]